MKIRKQHIVLLLLMVMPLALPAKQKNTAVSRFFQALNTRYNVYFNGMTSYEDGLDKIEQANKENYSVVIPMFPISHHQNAKVAKTDMDRTIEKCRKAIKLHSIKTKPKRNIKKWQDPAYQRWFNQEEFNPELKEAWILLGKAEFHKGDFIGSVGTFSYVMKHYHDNKDVVARCQLWITRAYAEMGWIFEAEEMLSKVKQDDLNNSRIGLFASVNADLLIKREQYKEAIPFLELALKKEHKKYLKQRFTFLLGQLYAKTGNKKEAFDAFTDLIKMNPPYEMDINARINRAELDQQNVASERKELNKLIKNLNNKDYLDQLYFALGETYIQHKDTAEAMKNYVLSAEKSTRNGIDKALTLIKLGDLYYQKQNYTKAQPCYDEASKIISVDNDDYNRVSNRAESLGELVTQDKIVILQDSLQHLATLSDAERLAIVKKVIKKLIADEKAAAEAAANSSNNANGTNFNNPGNMIGQTASWYFYNPNLVRAGKAAFVKTWGNRKLEDNWQRQNKSATLFADNGDTTGDNSDQGAATDSTNSPPKLETDNKKPEFYLQQIPVTPEQIAQSNKEIAAALFAMGQIYEDKIGDLPAAVKTFDEFEKRFPKDSLVVEALYQSYRMELQLKDDTKADFYKNKLVQLFPDSKYVQVITQPDYFGKLKKMYNEQDSLYLVTYKAFNASDFKTVFNTVAYVRKNFPLTSLMPKFMLLDVLSIGKTESHQVFNKALLNLVDKYPKTDVSSMAKDILALTKQGMESQKGTTGGTLLEKRDQLAAEQDTTAIAKKGFLVDKSQGHRLLFVSNVSQDKMNKLLFELATFNFTRFMIKDFDLVSSRLDTAWKVISVKNFDSYDEAKWYENTIEEDSTLEQFLNKLNITPVVISEDNYQMTRTLPGYQKYLAFADVHHLNTLAVNKKQFKESDFVKVQPKTVQQEVAVMQGNKNNVQVYESANKKSTVVAQTNKNVVAQTMQAETKVEKPAEKPVNKAVETTPEPQKPQAKATSAPLYKNLFAITPNEVHYVAILVLSGKFDYSGLKSAFDAYNEKNFGMQNLKLEKEDVGDKQVIIIGKFANASLAKTYLLKLVHENSLYNFLKGDNYRNLMGTQRNLNVMMQQNAMNTYFEFMRKYYFN